MPSIEGFHIQNYKVLKKLTIAKLWNTKGKNTKPLTPLTAVIGKNGVGKSTLFDAFGFLHDCLIFGVDEACYRSQRGGFQKIISPASKLDAAQTLNRSQRNKIHMDTEKYR